MSRRRTSRARSAPGARPAKAQARAAVARAPSGWERAVRGALLVCFALVLLMPFVVTPGTVYPFVVGKALWSRALIEVAFALWAVLALARPAYRPPRSWLLAVLGLGLAVSLVSGVLGVSLERSLWSDYERMLGLVDAAHWAALALVLASVVRTERGWRAVLGASAAAGVAMAGLVIARALGAEVPFYGALPEPEHTRIGGPLGNPTFLAVHLMANAVLAAGLAASAPTGATRIGWAAGAGVQLMGLALAGSVGGFAGLAAAAVCAALAFAWTSRGRARTAALVALALLALSGAALGARFLDPERTAMVAVEEGTALPGAFRYVAGVHLARPSVQSRLAAWEAGLAGFAERPLLGFGPDNFATVFGRHGAGYAATAAPHDLAHGKLVEVAATTGAAGLACWFALWGGALAVLLGAARATALPGRALAVCAAAALAGHLVQMQFLFDTATGSLLATVLLARAAWLEPRVAPARWRAQLPARAAALFARLAPSTDLTGPGARRVLGAAALALALAGLATNAVILGAADRRHLVPGAVLSGATAEGIQALAPLAGPYRLALFSELGARWPSLRVADPARAGELLALVGREATEALRRAPQDWRAAHLLAQLYRAVARTDPDYAAQAAHHLALARVLAPAREVFPTPLAPPAGLAATALADGRIEFSWRPAPRAGYHQIARSAAPAAWKTVLYAYGARRTTFVAPAGSVRYRIRACRNPHACSAWVEWP